MIPNEIIDAKVGTRQVTAIYLGENLVWPAVPIHYVITDARLVYSSGARLDAGIVGSQYTGNYAYALGTVRVQQGQVIIRELTNEPLNLSVSSQDFHVLRESGISYDIIRGNNLGTTATSAIKSTEVTVSYRDATPRSVGNVEQIINSYTETVNEWTEWDSEPTIERRPVSGSYWVTMSLANYDSPSRLCPAYGGSASLYVSAGHNEADYSFTAWVKLRTYTRTYTSGAVVTSNPEIIDQGTTTPQKVGSDIPVDDTATLNTFPAWLYLSGTTLNIFSESDDPYPDGRSFTITASNETATPASVTVYQQENEAEPDYIYETVWGEPYSDVETSNYRITASARSYASSANAANASGNVTSIVDVTAYHTAVDVTVTPYYIYETPHWIWTSGEESFGTRHLYDSDEEVVRGTPRTQNDPVPTPTITMYNNGGSGAASFSWRSASSAVYIPTEGAFEYTTGRYAEVEFENGDASAMVYIYQKKNVIVSTDATPVRHWDTDTHTDESNYDYAVDIQIFNYTSSNPVPASGGYAGIGYAAVHTHREVETQGYTDVVTPIYTWSSNATSQGETTSTRGSVTLRDETSQVNDIPTITVPSSASSWLEYDAENSRLKVESEGTTPYSSGRSAVITATNNGASDTASLYQAINRVVSTSYAYDLAVEIQQEGNIPANGGTLYVTYNSYRTATETYSSNATKTLAPAAYSSSVTGTNCTPSVNSASGQGAFQITVDANTSTTNTRSVSVKLAATSTEYVTSTKVQDKATPSVQKVATLKPWMINMQGTPFVVGKVYYQFTIDSGNLTSGTLTGVNFCYRLNGGTKNTVQIGTFAVSETSQPTALEPSGVNIPTFRAGDGLVTAWFEVTASKGGFDTINADEDNYSFEIYF